jgi:hypothetical protein
MVLSRVHVPEAAQGEPLWDRIEAAVVEGVAAQQTPACE